MLSLDTNVVIAILTGRSVLARSRLIEAQTSGLVIYVSSVVLQELWYGVAKSSRAQENASKLLEFLDSPLDPLALDADDARVAGYIRADLERNGTPIGPADLQIAGQAVAKGLTLVTDNEREFRRVAGLAVVNWVRDRA
jgi:tRNA(fMet)-specific endonuclease VapC